MGRPFGTLRRETEPEPVDADPGFHGRLCLHTNSARHDLPQGDDFETGGQWQSGYNRYAERAVRDLRRGC